MSPLCATPAERARKSYSDILQRLQEPGSQVALATALGVSESTVSRIKNERLEEVLVFLSHAGFKVVPADTMQIDPTSFEFLRITAATALSDPASARKLCGGS